MKKLNGLIIALMSVSAFSLAVPTLAKKVNAEVETITHKFGGTDGEWETDADNSTGVWNYYTTDGTLASKQAMKISEGLDNYTNDQDWFILRKDGYMHPGDNSCPTIGLIAEKSGTMSLTFTANRENSAPPASSALSGWDNGTKAFFFLNDEETAIGESYVNQAHISYTVTDIEVAKGDEIIMLLHHLNNTACDGASYTLTISIEHDDSKEEPEHSGDKKDTSDLIKHKYGGLNGEWETDEDNSTGVWNYYATTGTVASKQNMKLNGDKYECEGVDWYQVRKDGFMHPGDNACPAVGLIAEATGKMSLTLNTTRDNATDAASLDGTGWDNGTKAYFYLNNDDNLIGEYAVNLATGSYTLSDIDVTKGDEIIMIVDYLDSTACDGATYTLAITIDPDKEEGTGGESGDISTSDSGEPTSDSSEPASDSSEESSSSLSDSSEESSTYTPVHPADPTKEPLSGETESVNNIDDFRFYQGAKGFYYYYGSVDGGIAGLQELTASGTIWDTNDLVPYLGIRMDGLMHPGFTDDYYMAALAWQPEEATVVDIYLDTCMELLTDNWGDGVTISIYKNEEVLLTYKLTADDNIYNNSEPIVARVNGVELEATDKIYVTVAPNKNAACDGVLTYLEITWEKKAESKDDKKDSSSATTSEEKKDSTSATSEKTDEDTTKKGCKGAAIPSAIGLITLLGAILFKKRKGE